ncbi:hypothetical protein VTN77DRAFT_3002 [Rasamsonia byssochlamydoides]|uniref:uncharacterized protein n=1 Tax=Rasamsonia byssochlamydoides TaxID=89139 RepID=UPI003743197B
MENNTTAAVRTCGLCCHCGQGLPYMKSYFLCLFCDLRFCNGCHSVHHPSHEPFLKWLRDHPTARGALPDEKSCMNCRKMTHCCLSCEECGLHVCVDCIVDVRVSLINHEHRSMAFIKAPDDYGLNSYSLNCESCQKGRSLSHCGRCWSGIKKGDTFYVCVTCVKEYNGQIRFCESCNLAGHQEHEPSHKFASFLYRVDWTVDEKYSGVQCLDCNQQVTLNAQLLARHPHTRYQITMGEAERDRRIFQSYRSCARKPVRDIATVSDNAHQLICQCCWQQFPANAKTFLCSTCTFIACVSCAESGGARSHPHIMFSLLLQWTTPPDELWKSLIIPSTHSCDRCEKPIQPGVQSYIQCNHCHDWEICQDCLTEGENLPVRHSCPEAIEMTYFDPVDRGKEWLAEQLTMAQKAMTEQRQGTSSVTVATPSPTSSHSSFAIKRKPTTRAALPVAVQPVAVQPAQQQQQQQQGRITLSPRLEQLQGTITSTATTMSNKINTSAINSAGMKLLKGGLKIAGAVGVQVLKSQINNQLQMLNAQMNPLMNNQMINTMNTQMNNPLQTMNAQVNNPLQQMLDTAAAAAAQNNFGGTDETVIFLNNDNNLNFNDINSGGGLGGAGADTGNTVDMSSFWQPINSAGDNAIQ